MLYTEINTLCSEIHSAHTDILCRLCLVLLMYEGWNFNSGNYLFTTDAK